MLPEGEYWMHLRKSRADLEAEARGEGETLAKHKKALFSFAKKNSISVTRIYAEVISGESLIHRPEMLKMLKDLETEKPKGILVMDYDRLGRGDKLDQGLIERALKEANVLIVSPSETIDLNTDAGELTADVKGLFARMELRQITKRMQGGRRRSVESGNYIGTRPPFGYDIHKNEKGERYLVPNPEQAPMVRQIFDWYVNGKQTEDGMITMGSGKIATELNNLGIRTYTNILWEPSSVLSIIKNAVHIGRIQWGKKEGKKSKTPGKRRDVRTRNVEEWIDVRGKHEPIVSEELFQKAQEILKGKYHVPYQLENGITNPLAGIIRCAKCGQSMVLRPYTNQLPHIMCHNRACDNKSARFEYVEREIVRALEAHLNEYIYKMGKKKKQDTALTLEIKKSALDNLNRELKELESQKLKLHDLLERGVYDDETYLERSQSLSNRIEETKGYIVNAEKELKIEHSKEHAKKEFIPTLKNVVKSYSKSNDPAKKNRLMKSVLHYATYQKEKNQRDDDFVIVLHTKLR